MYQPDYKEILENATEYAIFSMDLDRRITTWNQGAERITGWSKDEAIGQLGDIIFPVNEKEDAKREIRNVQEKGVALDERWHVKKDGSLFYAVGRTMSITDSDEIMGYIKIMLDQTEKKQQEQLLQDLNRTLEKKVEARTKKLVDYQEKLRSLVVELNNTEELDKDLLSMMEWLAKRKKRFGLQVNIEDDGKPKPINDELLSVVFQSVRELLMNVIKHSEVNKAFMVLERDEHLIRISVRDEGKGFDPEEMEALPEKKGFGLFNLKERLNPLGGNIEIYSQRGSGTKVTISVPVGGKTQK